MAYDGLPHQGRLWRYVDSFEEWARRLERRYEEFETAAMAAGVDRRTVAEQFAPESAIWTPVQFRERFGTVEWRSPDTALPSQILALADHVTGTIEHLADAEVRIEGDTGRITDSQIVLPEFDTVLDHVNAAIRDGLESDSLWAYLHRMGFDVAAFDPFVHSEGSRGKITRETARELRLEYAERLKGDVRTARPVNAD